VVFGRSRHPGRNGWGFGNHHFDSQKGSQMNEWKSKADYRDPNWKTDIRKTFRRVEREIREVLKGKEPRRVRINLDQQSA
jgi:hypothetical protein